MIRKATLVSLVILTSSIVNDQSFYKKAGQYLQLEIELGRLAEQQGSHKTKATGKQVADDFTIAYTELKSVASTHSGQLTDLPEDSLKKELKDLSGLKDKAFDKAYTNSQRRILNQLVGIFKHEADSGSDQSAKAYAGRYLPKLYMHLQSFASDSLAMKIKMDSTPKKR